MTFVKRSETSKTKWNKQANTWTTAKTQIWIWISNFIFNLILQFQFQCKISIIISFSISHCNFNFNFYFYSKFHFQSHIAFSISMYICTSNFNQTLNPYQMRSGTFWFQLIKITEKWSIWNFWWLPSKESCYSYLRQLRHFFIIFEFISIGFQMLHLPRKSYKPALQNTRKIGRDIGDDISTESSNVKININNVCNLISVKWPI